MTFVAGAANFQTSNIGTVTINVPAGVANGDLMFALVGLGNGFMLNSAWTPISSIVTNHWLLYQRTAASEPANYTFSDGSGSGFPFGGIVAYRSVPLPSSVTTVNFPLMLGITTVPTPSVPAFGAGTYLTIVTSNNNASSNYFTTGPGGLTRDFSFDTSFTNQSIAAFSKSIPVAGMTGPDQVRIKDGEWSNTPTFTLMLGPPDPSLTMIQPTVKGRFA